MSDFFTFHCRAHPRSLQSRDVFVSRSLPPHLLLRTGSVFGTPRVGGSVRPSKWYNLPYFKQRPKFSFRARLCPNGAQRYEPFLQVGRLYRALIMLGLALCLPSASCHRSCLLIFGKIEPKFTSLDEKAAFTVE